MEKLIVPQVHINGTAKEELMNDLFGVMAGVRIAQQKLCHATPNARDYYHTGNYLDAREQFNRRYRVLDALLEELEKEADLVGRQ